MTARRQPNPAGTKPVSEQQDRFVLELTPKERFHVSDALTLELREDVKMLRKELKYEPISSDAQEQIRGLIFTVSLLDRVGWPGRDVFEWALAHEPASEEGGEA
jgi:hypothetical protein